MLKYAEILKICRKRSGFTQRDVSDLTGISITSIGNWENEKCIPNIVDFERVLNVYGLTIKIALMQENKERR